MSGSDNTEESLAVPLTETPANFILEVREESPFSCRTFAVRRCLSDTRCNPAGVAEWQTRRIQNPLSPKDVWVRLPPSALLNP